MIFGPVTLLVAGWVLTLIVDLRQAWDMTTRQAEQNARNLAHVLSEQTARTVQAVDLTLLDMVEAIERSPERPVHDPGLENWMRHRLSSLPYVRALYAIGADGFITQDTDPDTPRVSLADRDYFQAHLADPGLGLHIGPPLISRSVGLWFISLSRRITKPDGTFGGIAVAAMEPRYFDRFLSEIEVGGEGNVTIFRRDGTLVMRSPHQDENMGRSFADQPLFVDHLPATPMGTYWSISPIDGVRRVVSYRLVSGIPLVVLVGLAETPLRDPWWSDMIPLVGSAGLVTALVCLAAFLLLMQRRRDESAHLQLLELHRSHEKLLQSTMDALSAHVAILDEAGTVISVNRAWRHFADANEESGLERSVGQPYLRGDTAQDDPRATDFAALLEGRRSEAHARFASKGHAAARWFQMRARRFVANGRVLHVVAHEEVTELVRAEEELRRVTERLLLTQDEERRRIARELHDATAQNIVAGQLNIARLQQHFPPGARARTILEETAELLQDSLREIRTLSYVLHPPMLEESGLRSALRWYVEGFARRSGIDVLADIPADLGRFDRDVEIALFRVVQEALANIHRHSGSGTAEIELKRRPCEVWLRVTDTGAGIRDAGMLPAELRGVGVGIAGMRVRLHQLGGRIEIASSPAGTTVTASCPVAADPAGQDGGAAAPETAQASTLSPP